MKIIKIATELEAWELGTGSRAEQRLLDEGKLKRLEDGTYRVFSRETDLQGQVAQPGDFIKIDSAGFPYPNRRAYFLENHIPLGDHRYLQKAVSLEAWTTEEPMPPAVRFLVDSGKLRLDPHDPDHYFRACLWNAELFAAKDAVVVLDQITRDQAGQITEVKFHFIARKEFLLTHQIVE